MPRKRATRPAAIRPNYESLVGDLAELLAAARRSSARAVNALMTATYWEIGRRIVEFEQGGAERASYGEELLKHLAADLRARFGRGFSVQNLENMRLFYGAFGPVTISQTLSRKSLFASHTVAAPIFQTLSAEFDLTAENTQTPFTESAIDIRSTPSSISSTTSEIRPTPSGESASSALSLGELARALPLPWSHYVLLIRRARSPEASA